MNSDKEISKRARIASDIIGDKDTSDDIKQKAKAGLALLSISDQGGATWAAKLLKMFDDAFKL